MYLVIEADGQERKWEEGKRQKIGAAELWHKIHRLRLQDGFSPLSQNREEETKFWPPEGFLLSQEARSPGHYFYLGIIFVGQWVCMSVPV